MPQFDIFSFSSQIFWLFLFLLFTYSFLSYYLLPALAVSIKVRNRRLASTSTTIAVENQTLASVFESSKKYLIKPFSILVLESIFYNLLKNQVAFWRANVSNFSFSFFYLLLEKIPSSLYLGSIIYFKAFLI